MGKPNGKRADPGKKVSQFIYIFCFITCFKVIKVVLTFLFFIFILLDQHALHWEVAEEWKNIRL